MDIERVDIERELVDLETEMWRANRVVVSRFGVMGKAEVVPAVTKNENPFVRTDLSDLKVLPVGVDSALVTYKAAVTALRAGSQVSFEVLATSVYVRSGDGWRNMFHQQTPV